MSEKGGGFNLFNGFFDINGNGKTDAAEVAVMLMMLDEMDKGKKEIRASEDNITDLDDLDIAGI